MFIKCIECTDADTCAYLKNEDICFELQEELDELCDKTPYHDGLCTVNGIEYYDCLADGCPYSISVYIRERNKILREKVKEKEKEKIDKEKEKEKIDKEKEPELGTPIVELPEDITLIELVDAYFVLEAKILHKIAFLPAYEEECECSDPNKFEIVEDDGIYGYCLNCGGCIYR